jgi:hypothetical protein
MSEIQHQKWNNILQNLKVGDMVICESGGEGEEGYGGLCIHIVMEKLSPRVPRYNVFVVYDFYQTSVFGKSFREAQYYAASMKSLEVISV